MNPSIRFALQAISQETKEKKESLAHNEGNM
jgi:hypothetical protein